MSTIYNHKLFTVAEITTPYWQDYQITGLDITIHSKDVTVLSGYVGDDTEKNLPDDFTDQKDLERLTIKYWLSDDKTTLKTVAIFSKHTTTPFCLRVHTSVMYLPSSNNAINSKYLQVLKTGGIDEACRLLEENPTEFPLIPVDLFKDKVSWIRTTKYPNGCVSLRNEMEAQNAPRSSSADDVC